MFYIAELIPYICIMKSSCSCYFIFQWREWRGCDTV